MRHSLKSVREFLRTGWFWAFVLVALPNCAFNSGGLCVENCDGDPKPCVGDKCDPPPTPKAFEPGDDASDAIMCDIEMPLNEAENPCATPEEAADAANMTTARAATALVNGESSSFALDWSDDAKVQCDGLPRKIKYFGPYPQGLTLCVDCEQKIGAGKPYANPTAACVAKCTDLVNAMPFTPAEGTAAFCQAKARTATNYDKDVCYEGVCTSGGTPLPPGSFIDPRQFPEPVKWTDLNGVSDNNGTNSLVMTGPSGDYSAGAASAQIIKGGDAWVEFEVSEGGVAHVLSLRESKDINGNDCEDVFNCEDQDPGINNIGFGLILYSDNFVYVVESSPVVTVIPPAVPEPYLPGDRFRVRAIDNHDGKATISYSRVVGGVEQPPFYTSVATPAYPLRVDSTLRDNGSTLTNVNLVRIKK